MTPSNTPMSRQTAHATTNTLTVRSDPEEAGSSPDVSSTKPSQLKRETPYSISNHLASKKILKQLFSL